MVDQAMVACRSFRQRMAIARMVVTKPSIVVLDEATSALDTETEHKLHIALASFLKNRTTIIIAHRLSTIKNTSKIVVIDDGKIVEEGIHQDLLKKKGRYYDLYQFVKVYLK